MQTIERPVNKDEKRIVKAAVEQSKAYADRLMADHVRVNQSRGWLLAIGFFAIATVFNVLVSLVVITHG